MSFRLAGLYLLWSQDIVRHHRLGDNYWAAISYWLHFIARSKFGAVYFVVLMMRSGAGDGKPVPPRDRWGRWSSLYMFGPLALSLDKMNAKNTSKREIHGEQKF